jgi:hypothetical protein
MYASRKEVLLLHKIALNRHNQKQKIYFAEKCVRGLGEKLHIVSNGYII